MKCKWCVLLVFFFCGCREEIVHDLKEREANTLVGNLHRVMIEAEKVKQSDGLWSIAVDREEVAQSLKFLEATRALRRFEPSGHKGTSVLSTREDQRFFYERSLSAEIESTLVNIEGVLDARVHLHLPATDPVFGRPISGGKGGSGSVLLVVSHQTELTNDQVARLVAGASGLTPEGISVLTSQVPLSRRFEAIQEVMPVSDAEKVVPLVSTSMEMDVDRTPTTLSLWQRKMKRFPRLSFGLAAAFLLLGAWQLGCLVNHRMRVS